MNQTIKTHARKKRRLKHSAKNQITLKQANVPHTQNVLQVIV
jgi:hypothetical protein